jgi:hypothetical protein
MNVRHAFAILLNDCGNVKNSMTVAVFVVFFVSQNHRCDCLGDNFVRIWISAQKK